MISRELGLKLQSWFKKNHRPLPWRDDPAPYKVWLAEIMSQQTVMAALLPYYHRFLTHFPSVAALAQAAESEVMAAWAGLGYYSRARLLHRAAKMIHAEGFPQTYSEWMEIPGVGPYTAAAIASQVYNEPVPAWDGNVQRVMSRFLGRPDAYDKKFRLECEQALTQLLRAKGIKPSALNQALMELGAMVCTPRSPACGLCPIRRSCVALAQGLQEQLPPTKPRKSFISLETKALVVVRTRSASVQILLQKRPEGYWYKGLWDFPSELGGKTKVHIPFSKNILTHTQPLSRRPIKHSITRYKISIEPLRVNENIDHGVLKKWLEGSEWDWHNLDQVLSERFPLATTAKKILRVAALESKN
jgi:A/G-specific adenine glycosylase